jgi:hypothetical protein
LFERTPGGDKNQAAELIKFKIYMTLLLEGKENRAQSMMEQFQFTGDTPALYYAQAAWEFKHNNGEKAADWVASAKKIYSQPLNNIFADALYDVGWMQAPEGSPAPAFDASSLIASQTESGGGAPAVEPSPIPDSVAATSKQGEMANAESIASPGSVANPVTSGSQGIEAQPAASTSTESPASETSVQPTQTSSPVQSAGEAASPAATVAASSVSSGKAGESPVVGTKPSQSVFSSALAQIIAAASKIGVAGVKVTSPRTWLVAGLLLVGLFLLAWVIVPGLSRRYTFDFSDRRQVKSFLTPSSLKAAAASPEDGAASGNGFFGGPRQISARLTASSPFSRSGLYEPAGSGGAFHRIRAGTEIAAAREEQSVLPPVAEIAARPAMEPVAAAVTEVPAQERAIEPRPVEEPSVLPLAAEVAAKPAMEPVAATMTVPLAQEQAIPQVPPTEEPSASPSVAEAAVATDAESARQPQFAAIHERQAIAQMHEPAEKPSELPVVAEGKVAPAIEPMAEAQFEAIDQGQPITQMPRLEEKLSGIPAVVEEAVTPVDEPVAKPQFEAVEQEQLVAKQMPISAMEPPAVTELAVVPSHSSNISNAPVSSQATTSLTMPEQPEQFQRGEAPVAEGPLPPVSAAQTPVQLTFSFEIVSVQLTPTFKISTLKVRPASKIVTMRLASSQASQPQLNPQVAFEVAKIQPSDSGLGTVRLVKSTPQRQQIAQQPADIVLPSFEVTGLQPISSSDGVAGVQLAPSEPGKAHVQVTADFQMAKVEFSTSFEITGVVLNATSKQVSVRLAGADPSAIGASPVFDLASVRLTDSGDGEMLELHAV